MSGALSSKEPSKKSIRWSSKLLIVFGLVTVAIAVIIVWFLIAEFSPGIISPKSDTAQKEINTFLDDNNLNAVAKLTSYSCTGHLPFVEDICGGDILIETEDFSKLAILQKFSAARGDLRIDFVYKGITYSSGLRSTQSSILNIQTWLSSRPDMKNVIISEGEDKGKSRITIKYDDDYAFSESCTIAKESLGIGYDSVYVYPGKDSSAYGKWAIDNLNPERANSDFDTACSAITKFLADNVSKDARVTFQVMGSMSKSEMGILLTANSNSFDKENARAWPGWDVLPKTILVR